MVLATEENAIISHLFAIEIMILHIHLEQRKDAVSGHLIDSSSAKLFINFSSQIKFKFK